MATRSFWKSQSGSGKDKTGTPSTTPSTSLDGSDLHHLDISATSLRNSGEKANAGVLTAAALESVFLWKQPSKRRLFGGSNPQKRYFVLTPNELAYKEKDSEDAEFKMIWKIGTDVIRVEPPETDSKEFNVIIVESGAPRTLRLLGADAASAKKFATAVEVSLKAASLPKSIAPPAPAPVNTTLDELSIEDSKATIMSHEQPSAIETIEEASLQSETDVAVAVTTLTESTMDDAPVPIEERSETKPAVWFWGCCSAE